MKILITGAFGNIGLAVIKEAYRRNHEIIVFEIDNKKNLKTAKKYQNKVHIFSEEEKTTAGNLEESNSCLVCLGHYR